MALVRGRPWHQYEAARQTEQLLLQHPTQDATPARCRSLPSGSGGVLPRRARGSAPPLLGVLEDTADRNDLFLGSWLNALLASQLLARGRPDAARQMWLTARRMWAALADNAESMPEPVLRRGSSAPATATRTMARPDRVTTASHWFEPLRASLVPFLRCRVAIARGNGRARLRGAAKPQLEPGAMELLARPRPASRSSQSNAFGMVARFVLPHYRNLATLLRAGLAGHPWRHRKPPCCGLTRGLEQDEADPTTRLRSAHAHRARGLLLGASEGRALCARAEADLRAWE